MTSYNAFSYIPVMKTDFILKTSIDKKTCEELIEITKDKLDEEIDDNLSNVRRTIWELHTDEDAGPIINKIMDHMNYCIRTRLNFPHPNQSEPPIFENKMFFYSFATFNSWVAHYKNESFVEPHCHVEYPNFWSCALYLSTGGDETSLSFLSDEAPSFNQNKINVPCKEGDMLIFPSSLVHYTDDTFDKRIVMSANAYAGFGPNFLNHGNPKAEETTGES